MKQFFFHFIVKIFNRMTIQIEELRKMGLGILNDNSSSNSSKINSSNCWRKTAKATTTIAATATAIAIVEQQARATTAATATAKNGSSKKGAKIMVYNCAKNLFSPGP